MDDVGPTELNARETRNASPDRLLAFTDGVFAIIITILVLEIAVPDLGPDQTLRQALDDLRPTFVAYAISFVLVGAYWMWHRNAFSQVRYIDNNVLWLNLAYLLTVALVPFAAATLGEYDRDPIALHLYGGVLIAATLARVAVDWYLGRHAGLLWQPMTTQAKRLSLLTAAAPIAIYAIGMAFADVAPNLTLLMYVSMPLLYLILIVGLKSGPRTRIASEDLS
jgi:uncharacterized membrane protein